MKMAMQRFWLIWSSLERRVLGRAATLLFAAGTLLVVVEVFQRYVFNTTFPWSTEIVVYLFVFSAWLYFGMTHAEDGHLRVGLIYDRIRGPMSGLLHFATDCVGLAFCVLIFWSSLQVALKLQAAGSTMETLNVPMNLVYAVLCVGMATLGLGYLRRLTSRR